MRQPSGGKPGKQRSASASEWARGRSVPPSPAQDFSVRGEFIQLDQLLKATGLADSGGTAHALITAGEVRVDGQVERRKRAKLRAGQEVSLGGARIRLQAGAD